MKAIFTLLCLFCAAGSFAHPPSRITVHFDPATYILKVTMHHEVKDTVKHFINRIEIVWNEQEAVRQDFIVQLDSGKQEALYIMPGAKPGDKITVTSHCNVYGKKKEAFQL
jgi:desulfoferrodoxin (superoxide reductase-like protein)